MAVKHYAVYSKDAKLDNRLIAKVFIPEDLGEGIDSVLPGTLVVLDQLETSIANNVSVYKYTSPTATNIKENNLGIVLRADFEKNANGAIDEVNADWTTYTHKPGDIATVFRLGHTSILEISADAINGTPTLNEFLIPTATSKYLTPAATVPEGVFGALKVLAVGYMGKGDVAFGTQHIKVYVCRTVDNAGLPAAA